MVDLSKLKIYDFALELGKDIYELTKNFPKDEQYGLISQMKRAVSSVGANIAEGAGRNTRADFHKFLYISRGSLREIKYFIDLSRLVKYITEEQFALLDDKIDKLSAMITLFIQNS